MTARIMAFGGALGVALLVTLSCRRVPRDSRTAPDSPSRIRMIVQMNDRYRSAELRLRSADAGVIWNRVVAFPENGWGQEYVVGGGWTWTPGEHRFEIAFEQWDGGLGMAVAPLPISGREIELSGNVTLFETYPYPQMSLELVEPAPPSIAWEPLSPISAPGHATYRVSNGDGGTVFATRDVRLERQTESTWEPLGSEGFCWSPDDDAKLPAGSNLLVDVTASECRTQALQPGRYRHEYRLEAVEPLPAWETYDAPFEVLRVFQLVHEFEVTRSGFGERAHVLARTPVSHLRRTGAVLRGSGSFSAAVVAPDGARGCLCPGVLVGRERLSPVWGPSGLCLTANPDASVVTCEPVRDEERPGPNRGPGDFPPYFPAKESSEWELEY